MADQVDLADFGQRRWCVGERGRGQQLGHLSHRHIARRQPVSPAAGMAELEQELGGLLLLHNDYRFALASAENTNPQAAANPSISFRVRFSVTATVRQSFSVECQRPRCSPAW